MDNKKIKIICDSSVDLLKETIALEDITIMPFPINIGGKCYHDGVDISVKELYALIDKHGELPKTAAFNSKDYEAVWDQFSDYDDIIFIGLGSGFSSSFNNALLSTEDYPNVHIIDSKNLSSGTALLVLKMCKMRREGLSATEIVSKIEEMVPYVRSQFAINTFEYLHKGGRCSGVSKLLGTLLKIKPIIKVVDNKMVVSKKPIGYNKAIKAMLDDVLSNKDQVDLDHIMITHSLADNDAQMIKKELAQYFDQNILMETYASGTISTHCGPRTIGILYLLKKEGE